MKLLKLTTVFFILTSSLLLFSSNSSNSVFPVAKSVSAATKDKKGIPILLYHHILKKSENWLTNDDAVINLESFEEQMKYLHDEGYHTATISELDAYLRGEKVLPDKTVMITFDDGLKTNYIYAYPVLKKYGFNAVAFIITNRVSNEPVPFNPKKLQFLSWPEINDMKDVFEFGSHTNGMHNMIHGVPLLLKESDQAILQDLETSRKLLNNPDSFAYPFGAYNIRTIELLKKAGFKYAFTTADNRVKIGDNPYELGRIVVGPSTTLNVFKKLVLDGARTNVLNQSRK